MVRKHVVWVVEEPCERWAGRERVVDVVGDICVVLILDGRVEVLPPSQRQLGSVPAGGSGVFQRPGRSARGVIAAATDVPRTSLPARELKQQPK